MSAATLSACAPTVVPGGESKGAPRLTADRYIAADGTELALAHWPAQRGPAQRGPAEGPPADKKAGGNGGAVHTSPKVIVLGLHGFGDYRNAFEEPAAIWAKAGIETYAYDQRGFGKSPTRGRWPGTDTLVSDALAVAALIRQQHPGVPLYIAGESMGGAVALVAADRGLECDGLILLAPALRSRETFGPLFSGGLWFFAHTIPWIPAGPTSIDFQPTDNPKTLEKLRNDPLMLRQPRLDMGYGLVNLMDDARASSERIHVPYMMLHGLGDRIVPSGPVKSAIEIMPPRDDSKLAFYKQGYHLLLRDKEGPVVAADIVSWIGNHQAVLPSGADADSTKPELAALWGAKRPR